MKQLLIPIAFGLLFPTAVLAQVDGKMAAHARTPGISMAASGPSPLLPNPELISALWVEPWVRWLQV